MRTIRTFGVPVALVALGYVLGNSGALRWLISPTYAQVATNQAATQDEQSAVDKKVEAAILATDTAMRALIADGGYVPAIQGPNSFAVTAGRGDMIQALEENQSVDPETYVGLYAGMAVPEVQEKLGKDEMGRLTYNGNVVRMYPIPQLKTLFQARMVLAEHLRDQQQGSDGDQQKTGTGQ